MGRAELVGVGNSWSLFSFLKVIYDPLSILSSFPSPAAIIIADSGSRFFVFALML